MKKYIVLSALVLAPVFLTGCVGLVVDHPREKCTTQFCLGSRGSFTNAPAASGPLTEARVLELWGKPDTILTNRDGLTVWHYKGGRNWSFVMPAYFIGLPIPVASGHNHVDIYFKDGIAHKARGTVDVVSGAMIGVAPPLTILACEKEVRGDENAALVGCGFYKDKQTPASRHDD
jgi:hypothetical protein